MPPFLQQPCCRTLGDAKIHKNECVDGPRCKCKKER